MQSMYKKAIAFVLAFIMAFTLVINEGMIITQAEESVAQSNVLEPFRVMSFNIWKQLDTDADTGNFTEETKNRINALQAEILSHSPDFLGLQEDHNVWHNNLTQLYSEYGVIKNSYTSNTVENCAIFYKKGISCIVSGTLWLSSDGTSGTAALTYLDLTTEGGKYHMTSEELAALQITEDVDLYETRTYTLGEDKETQYNYTNVAAREMTYGVFSLNGENVLYVNTHLQNTGNSSASYYNDEIVKLRELERLKHVEMMQTKIQELQGQHNIDTVIITGDFNAERTSSVYEAMKAYGYVDTAAEMGVPAGTWNNSFDKTTQGNTELAEATTSSTNLDYCFVNANAKVNSVTVGNGYAEITTDGSSAKKIYTSDHRAVVAELSLIDTSWFDENVNTKTYEITNAKELMGFAELLAGGESFEGWTVKLADDISINTVENGEVGTAYPWPEHKQTFKGTFNGQEHTISGVYINATANNRSMFGELGDNAKIQNLNIKNSKIDITEKGGTNNTQYIGLLAGKAVTTENGAATISNVHCSDITITGTVTGKYVGGFIGGDADDSFGNLVIENSSVGGNITGCIYAAGFIGLVNKSTGSVKLDSCSNTANIAAGTNNGQIISYVQSGTVTLKDCRGSDGAYGSDTNVLTGKADVAVTYERVIPNYDGTADTSWYTGNASEYTLNTAQELMGFAKLLAGDTAADATAESITFENVTIKLGSDIVLNAADSTAAYDWPAVNSTFKGTFDGGGYKISGLRLSVSAENSGMFGVLNGTVKNVTFINPVIISAAAVENVGVVAGEAAGTVEITDVTVENISVTEGENAAIKFLGGIVGNIGTNGTNAVIKDCKVSGNVSATGSHNGGIIGQLSTPNSGVITAKIIRCSNEATVNTVSCGGGIVGYLSSGSGATTNVTIAKCSNSGAVSSTGTSANTVGVGGIVGVITGSTSNVSLYSCSNSSDSVTIAGGEYAGELIGRINKCKLVALTTCQMKNGEATDSETGIASINSTNATVNVIAQEELPVDMSWYTGDKTEYTLSTLKQLIGFSRLVNGYTDEGEDVFEANDFSGITIKLGADITFDESSAWEAVNAAFAGSFDGGNHKITGLNLSVSGESNGMFGILQGTETAPAVVRNLVLENPAIMVTADSSYVGAVAGQAQGHVYVQNVTINNMSVTGESTPSNLGGVIGRITGAGTKAVIENCEVSSTGGLGSGATTTGGIIGDIYAVLGGTTAAYISNCINTAGVSGTTNIGGIVGYISGKDSTAVATVNLYNCTNQGAVSTPTETKNPGAGGMVGRVTTSSSVLNLDSCSNSGTLDTTSTNVGEIIGLMSNGKVTLTACMDSKNNEAVKDTNPCIGSVSKGTVTYNEEPAIDKAWHNEYSKEFVLTKANQLLGFAQLLSEGISFDGVTIKLDSDISLNDENAETKVMWPAHNKEFKGTFDGQNHTISGVYISASTNRNAMFGILGGTAVVKNVNIKDTHIEQTASGKNGLAVIAGEVVSGAKVTISDITIEAEIKYTGTETAVKYVGGFIGKVVAAADVEMTNCSFKGTISNVSEAAGGMIGYVSYNGANIILDNCSNSGTINATSAAGQLIGHAAKATVILENCSGSDSSATAKTLIANIVTGEDAPKICDKTTAHIDTDDNGICDYTYCAKPADGKSALAGGTITLGGKLGVNFHFVLDESLVAENSQASIKFTLPDMQNTSTEPILLNTITKDAASTYYVITCEVAAKEMTGDITATITVPAAEGTEGYNKSYIYSVADYAKYILENSDNNTEYAKAADLVAAMLNYGGYAQTYFKHNTDDLATKYIGENILADINTKMEGITAATLPDSSYSVEGTFNDRIAYAGTSIGLKSDTIIRHYFTLTAAGGFDEYAVKIGSEELQKGIVGDSMFYVDIEDIAAHQLGDIFTIAITSDIEPPQSVTLNYSVYTYVKAILQDTASDAALSNLVKAICLYGEAAKAYNAVE